MQLSPLRFLIGTLLGASALLAMEPPNPGMIEVYRRDGTLSEKLAFAKSLGNHRMSNGLAKRAQYKLMKAAIESGQVKSQVLPTPPGARKDMPTKGIVKTLTICIDFSDYPHNDENNSIAQMRGRIFGDGDALVPPPNESYRNFYLRSSYGQLDLQGSVLGWYRPGYKRADMALTSDGRENLIKEALAYYDTLEGGHDFSQYDNNKDGKIDFMSVIWSGPVGEWSTFWWGYQTGFNDGTFKVDGIGLGKYSWQWESYWGEAFSPETMIHEQGHGLGLPDYYDYDGAIGPMGGVGGLDTMASDGDHNCFSKWLLDWIDPIVVDTRKAGDLGAKTLQDQTIRPPDLPTGPAPIQNALIVMPEAAFPDKTKPFGEFFMVQNRQLTGNDADRRTASTGHGLLIWHVDSRLNENGDDFLYDNSLTKHKLLRLMEADGLEQIEQGSNANAGDFYVNGSSIGPATTPSTTRYSGVWTYFGVNNISASGPSMTFDIFTEPADATAPTGKPDMPAGSINVDVATFTWRAGTSADPEGLIGYELEVGTTPGARDVFSDIVGNILTLNMEDLGRHDERSLYARVRAVNKAGLSSEWSDISEPRAINLPIFSANLALDNFDLTFKRIGTWQADESFYRVGDTSVQGICPNNGRTTLQTRVTGPGTMDFWWKGSTENGFDFYSVMIDGATATRISGEQEWAKYSIKIPGGSHVVGWRWSKDGSSTGSLDRVWVDDVKFTTAADPDGGAGDILDLVNYTWAYNSSAAAGSLNWLPACDLNGNGIVEDADINLFLAAAGF